MTDERADVQDPAAVAAAYFAAVARRDVDSLRRLFASDAELVAAGTTYRGSGPIAQFYEAGAFTFDDLLPRPGNPEVSGDRVHVVIDLHMGGADHVVADTFQITGGLIRRLEITFLPRRDPEA
jgi:ketosteroid isomerase-like protein